MRRHTLGRSDNLSVDDEHAVIVSFGELLDDDPTTI
jgi:hypothetical protein